MSGEPVSTAAGDAPLQLVFMGVSGCGKSTLARAVAEQLGWPLIEGDEFHPPANVEKMRNGVPLADADRSDWLDELARQLAAHGAAGRSVALTCSALKRSYRERLRQASPALGFVFLEIEPTESLARVAQRSDHLFPPSLVASQFTTLESPVGEPGVLRVDAGDSTAQQLAEVMDWLGAASEPRRSGADGGTTGTWFASSETSSKESPMSNQPSATPSTPEPSVAPNESVETVGSHPLGAVAGALGGAATGAVVGIAAGPLGSLVGAIGGAVLGGAAGAGGGGGPEVAGEETQTGGSKP